MAAIAANNAAGRRQPISSPRGSNGLINVIRTALVNQRRRRAEIDRASTKTCLNSFRRFERLCSAASCEPRASTLEPRLSTLEAVGVSRPSKPSEISGLPSFEASRGVGARNSISWSISAQLAKRSRSSRLTAATSSLAANYSTGKPTDKRAFIFSTQLVRLHHPRRAKTMSPL